jgi:hypothetical protein
MHPILSHANSSHANSSQWTSTGTASCLRFLCTGKGREPFFCMQTVFVWQCWHTYLILPLFCWLIIVIPMKWQFWGNSPSASRSNVCWLGARIHHNPPFTWGVFFTPQSASSWYHDISWFFWWNVVPECGLKMANNIKRPNEFLANFP